MKNIITLFAVLIASILFTSESIACIDPGPDTSVNVVVSYDTSKFPCIEEVEIRITNLRFMTENPGKICSCALDAWNALMQNVVYIAFVDSGTNSPYLGFASWNTNAAASLAWKNAQPSYNWGGFIANVIGSGLSATSSVELVIRLKAPIGQKYTLTGDSSIQARSLVADIEGSTMGTDAWDDVAQDLDKSHTGIYAFDPNKPGNSIQFISKPDVYFTTLDDEILNNIPSNINALTREISGFSIFPVPSNGLITAQFDLVKASSVKLELYSITGSRVKLFLDEKLSEGKHQISFHSNDYQSGIYIMKYTIDNIIYSKKIVVE